ncbi:MAG: succinate dehydrogenase cytochrome b subunit [Actinomycetota bacterium]
MAVTQRPQDKLRTPKPINKPPRFLLPWPLNLYQTAIGKKWVMALTGLGLVGFVVAHMIGNLHLYEGQFEVAEYAEALRTLGAGVAPRGFVLWILRLGLIGMFALHIHSAVTLTRINAMSNARYESPRDYAAANVASRTTRITGIIIAVFVVWHLADLTWGWTDGFMGWRGDGFNHGDPLWNVDQSMSNVGIAIWYMVATVAVAVHLYHGIRSAFTSIGVNSPKFNPLRRPIAASIAGLVLVGNLLFPIMVLTGVLEADEPLDIEELHHSEEASP